MNGPEDFSRKDTKNLWERVTPVLLPVLAAATVALAIWGVYTYRENARYKRMMEMSYRRAVQNASVNLANISTDLAKGMYAGTAPQLSQISSRLWKEASFAKSSLCSLPIAEMHLDNTSRFLSQVGEYAMYLSRKSHITQKERADFQHMREYADRLSQQVDELDNQLEQGEITFAQIKARLPDSDKGEAPAVTSTSLDAMEGGFTGYPSLLYDGPFSDHILDKSPAMLKGKRAVTEEEARQKAQLAAGENTDLSHTRQEDSHLPCYVFYSDGRSVAVTRNGGYLCYMTGPKPDSIEIRLSPEEALDAARKYLQNLGIQSMKDTYYEIHDGVMTVNFAFMAHDILCYTDLIKTDVSMETGEILALDARGYLVNHHARTFGQPRLSEEQARISLSPLLTAEPGRLTLIPTPGKQEILAYEFKSVGSGGDSVLVYINADTGAEEQLLLLIENENGVLTK